MNNTEEKSRQVNGDQAGEKQYIDTQPVQYIQPSEVDDVLVRARQMSESLDNLRKFALGKTRPSDWSLFGDSIHMDAKCAESIASVLGISWPRYDDAGHILITAQKEDLKDGHYAFIFMGEFHWFGRKIAVEGSAKSNKPFFDKSGKLPAEEVDLTTVRSAAYSNMVINGVRRITGLHNVTLEDLKPFGITEKNIKVVRFTSDSKNSKLGEAEHKMLKIIDDILSVFYAGQPEKRKQSLEKLTEFMGKDKTKVPGVIELKQLKSKPRITFLYSKVIAKMMGLVNETARKVEKDTKERQALLTRITGYHEGEEVFEGSHDLKKVSPEQLIRAYNVLIDMQAKQEESK